MEASLERVVNLTKFHGLYWSFVREDDLQRHNGMPFCEGGDWCGEDGVIYIEDGWFCPKHAKVFVEKIDLHFLAKPIKKEAKRPFRAAART